MPLKTHYESLYIGGSWVKPNGSETCTVINPATEEAIDNGPWPKMEWRERAVILQQFHDALVARKDEIVQLCVAEAGSIIPVATIMQFDMALDGLQYYIDQIQRREFVIPSSVSAHTNWATGGETLGSTVKVYEPLGVSVGITAYNYPFFLNLAKLGPAARVFSSRRPRRLSRR
jgi:aldehyde dehydrogenase (NAD+)